MWLRLVPAHVESHKTRNMGFWMFAKDQAFHPDMHKTKFDPYKHLIMEQFKIIDMSGRKPENRRNRG